MVQYLSGRGREKFRDIYHEIFESDLPSVEQANIIAIDDKAFITVEVLLRAGMVWVEPSIRNTPESARCLKELVTHLQSVIPKGSSVIAIASTEKEKRLMKRLKMRPIEGQVFRIDV